MVSFWASSPHILCISVFSSFVFCGEVIKTKTAIWNTMFVRLCFLRDAENEFPRRSVYLPSSFCRFLTVNINAFQFRYPCSFSVDGIRVKSHDVDSFLHATVVLYQWVSMYTLYLVLLHIMARCFLLNKTVS